MEDLTKPQSPHWDLEQLAKRGRWLVLETVTNSKAGHVGGPLSAMDLLVALYFRQLSVDVNDVDNPDRDRFILSKGHCAIGLYTTLALRGYFPEAELATFDHGDSRLQGHPDMRALPGLDASTGSLGQGLSVGAGMAMGAKMLGKDFHTWVMLGDGEIQEGMVWEAVYTASRYKLDNLTAIVDRNGLQQYGWPADGNHDARFDRSDPWSGINLPDIFAAYGWNVVTINGHDFDEILKSYENARKANGTSGKPTVIIAETIKGKGISFTEGTYKWHNGVATTDQLELARQELGQVEPIGELA